MEAGKKVKIPRIIFSIILLAIFDFAFFYVAKTRIYWNSWFTWFVFIVNVVVLGMSIVYDFLDWYSGIHSTWVVDFLLFFIICAIAYPSFISMKNLFGSASDKYNLVSQNLVVSNKDVSDYFNGNDTNKFMDNKEVAKICKNQLKDDGLNNEYEIKTNSIGWQYVDGELFYIIPLEPRNVISWMKDNGIKGYYLMDADKNVEFINETLHTSEYSFFNSNVKRIAINYMKDNNIDGIIESVYPQIDGNDLHYILPIKSINKLGGYEYLIGLVDINASTLECGWHGLDNVPSYINKIVSMRLFQKYVSYYERLEYGYIYCFTHIFQTIQEDVQYNAIDIDGRCYYYTSCLTIDGDMGLMVMDALTGEFVLYK